MKLKKVGMRTIKTAITVSLTIFIAQLLNLKSPFFAGIAAIIIMESSVSESIHKAKNRMYSTIIGAIIALIFSFIAPLENPIFIGVGTLIIIHLCNMLELKESITLATIVFLSIILNYEEGSRISYALNRTLDTFVGLIIGTLVNYFICPPRVDDNLCDSVDSIYLDLKSMIENIIWTDEEISFEPLRKKIIDLEENHILLKKEARLKLSKSGQPSTFEQIFNLFENIYNHLSIIDSINITPYINEQNKKSLENLLNRKVPCQEDSSKENIDFVYNYHLEQILTKLELADNMIDKKTR